jgi:aerotaxis receptor
MHLGHALQLRVGEVHGAMHQLDGITQQNASMVEQLARASRHMLADTEQVNAALQIFRLAANEKRTLPDAVDLRRAAKQA